MVADKKLCVVFYFAFYIGKDVFVAFIILRERGKCGIAYKSLFKKAVDGSEGGVMLHITYKHMVTEF